MFKMRQSVLLQLVCVSLIVSHYCNDGLKQSHQISFFVQSLPAREGEGEEEHLGGEGGGGGGGGG